MIERQYRVAVLEDEPNDELRRCYDCFHCKAALSWWCTNDEAIESRGSALPTAIRCSFWKPAYTIQELEKYYQQELEEYKALPLWKRLFTKPPVKVKNRFGWYSNLIYIETEG